MSYNRGPGDQSEDHYINLPKNNATSGWAKKVGGSDSLLLANLILVGVIFRVKVLGDKKRNLENHLVYWGGG